MAQSAPQPEWSGTCSIQDSPTLEFGLQQREFVASHTVNMTKRCMTSGQCWLHSSVFRCIIAMKRYKVFWNITPRQLVGSYRRFEEA